MINVQSFLTENIFKAVFCSVDHLLKSESHGRTHIAKTNVCILRRGWHRSEPTRCRFAAPAETEDKRGPRWKKLIIKYKTIKIKQG